MQIERIVNCYDRAVPLDGRTAVSVRDGVIEYYGSELGIEDEPGKLFTVYRSPATIANTAQKMVGIPLTDGHVDVESDVIDAVGSVESSEMVDLFIDGVASTVGIKNVISTITNELSGQELSLGYRAALVPHSKYDFEQRDIVPHHVAAVPAGRCGYECRFFDAKPKEEPNMAGQKKEGGALTDGDVLKPYRDEAGALNLEAIMEMVMALPEAFKKAPVDEVQKLLPALQELIAMSGSQGAEPQVQEAPKEEMEDEESDMESKEQEPKFEDSAAFRDAVAAEVKRYSDVIAKAKEFLDESYNYAGKSTDTIMADAVATIYKDKFKKEELAVAFKMLRKPASNLANFGDSADAGIFQSLKDKEL